MASRRGTFLGVLAALFLVSFARAAEPTGKPIVRETTAASERFDGGKKWAVVVGVNDYTDAEIPDLKYCVADAQLVAKSLTEDCGYDADNVLLMTDDQPKAHLRPTRLALQQQIAAWLKRAADGDTVIVFFSGHGFLDARQQGFLATQDADKTNLGLTTLRTDDLRDMLRQCKATQKMLILDCCHAGGTKDFDVEGKVDNETAHSSEEVGESFRAARGLITLASCGESQKSHEWDEKQHGVFTFHLCEGLNGKADKDGDAIVTSAELYDYALVRVSSTTAKQFGAVQEPRRISGEDVVGDFALARVKIVPEEMAPSRRRLATNFTVTSEEDDSQPLAGVAVVLWYRPSAKADSLRLAQGQTNADGVCQLVVDLDRPQQTAGEFAVRIAEGTTNKSWKLPLFLRQREWTLALPTSSTPPDVLASGPKKGKPARPVKRTEPATPSPAIQAEIDRLLAPASEIVTRWNAAKKVSDQARSDLAKHATKVKNLERKLELLETQKAALEEQLELARTYRRPSVRLLGDLQKKNDEIRTQESQLIDEVQAKPDLEFALKEALQFGQEIETQLHAFLKQQGTLEKYQALVSQK